ncbi:MAG: OmpA family protein [Candidatus Cloacimonetes bacterium]|nr:OmpA family protein [Candidatus Cloacimonadota bacterium]
MMKKLTIWLIVLLACQLAFAQIGSRTFVNAQQYYEMGEYIEAKQSLSVLDKSETKNLEYALLRGKVHLALGEYKDAHFWLSEYGKNSLGTEPLVRGELLDKIYLASLYQEQSSLGIALGKVKGNINSSDSEYAPVLTPDGKYMYFSSLRRSTFAKENIFFSAQDKMVWSTPEEVNELNTDYNESLGSLSLDVKTAYLFGYYKKTNTNGDIYTSTQKENGRWSKPQIISEVSSKYYDLQPYVHNDEVMVFTSNRHGNHDNHDLYISLKRGDTWSEPVNLGAEINTIYDEQSAFISPDGRTLYFASNGHPGYGGYDIFRSERIGDSWTLWTTPQNMGPIINSNKDDRYYRISPDGQYAYLSSNRYGGMGQEDIYYLDLELFRRVQSLIDGTDDKPAVSDLQIDKYEVSGLVTDDSGRPLQAEVVWIYTLGENVFMRIVPTDGMGAFQLTLPPNVTDVSYEVNEPGYQPASASVEMPKDTAKVHVKITCFSSPGMSDMTNLIINGQVLDEENRPVQTTIRWSYVWDSELHEVLVESSENGNFKLHLPIVDKLKYAIKDHRYGPREEILTLPKDINSYDVVIRLVSLGNEIKVSGLVSDQEGKPLIANLFWSYEKDDELVVYRVLSDIEGQYTVTLPRLEAFDFRVAKTNYMQISGILEVAEESYDITKDFELQRLVEEGVFELKNVEFEFNKAVLTPASLKILAPVLETMRSNESLEIELSGHTDNIGTRAINMRLSKERAQAVADYLIDNEIEESRISTVGYGFDKPIATNDTAEGRQRNRRTELKILGIEYADDLIEDWEKDYVRAGKQARIVSTIDPVTSQVSTQFGIPQALEDEFRNMILVELQDLKQAQVKVDLFIDKGKIQSANVRDLMGNLNDQATEQIADLMLGWQVQSKQRSIYSFTVKK